MFLSWLQLHIQTVGDDDDCIAKFAMSANSAASTSKGITITFSIPTCCSNLSHMLRLQQENPSLFPARNY